MLEGLKAETSLSARLGASAVYRCLDRKVRRYLTTAAILMVVWMIIVLIKCPADNLVVVEVAWYLFYVPMLFLPLLVLRGYLGPWVSTDIAS